MNTTHVTEWTWINEPKQHTVRDDTVTITTDPNTDLWQRTFYGFRPDNAHGLVVEARDNFTFSVRVQFEYLSRFDQCGVMIYLDSENWFKASIEYETVEFSRLGSVVTNLGYSDWATTDIPLPTHIWYRLNRRGPDFLIESSRDGVHFNQMRVFHLHKLGETTAEMGRADPPLPTTHPVNVGVYACSPTDSSFTAEFSNLTIGACTWRSHAGE